MNADRLRPELSVEEEIRQANPLLSRTQVRTLCGAMMFGGEAAEKRVSVLSGGERSRVLLGKILASPVNLLLLDEPTNHLDQESVDAFVAAVDSFGGAVILVTHVERILEALATRLVVFDGGKVEVFHGGYADFLERVGWRAEAEQTPRAGRDGRAGRRDGRRERAEAVARRSRELGKLRRSIAAMEAEIIGLEERVARDDAAIVEAAVRNDGAAIRALSPAVSAARGRIEALFVEMTALAEELHRKEREHGAERESEAG
jgi:ATP-binding cassette subfamily F protein 3